MTAAERKTYIEQTLTNSLSPSFLNVIDESYQHIGHAGAKGGASHFAVEITADCLKDLSRVQQHQKIYALLSQLIPQEIHALRIVIL